MDKTISSIENTQNKNITDNRLPQGFLKAVNAIAGFIDDADNKKE